MRQSKKCSASGISRTSASTPCTRRKRRISSWNGSGRPAASSATTSPSRMNGSPDRSRRAISTTSGRLRVTSDRRRLHTCAGAPGGGGGEARAVIFAGGGGGPAVRAGQGGEAVGAPREQGQQRQEGRGARPAPRRRPAGGARGGPRREVAEKERGAPGRRH